MCSEPVETATSIGADGGLADGTAARKAEIYISLVNTEKEEKGHRREKMRARPKTSLSSRTHSFLARGVTGLLPYQLDWYPHGIIDGIILLCNGNGICQSFRQFYICS